MSCCSLASFFSVTRLARAGNCNSCSAAIPACSWRPVANVAAPAMEALVTLAGVLNGIDYRSEGLTLDRMGLAGMSADDFGTYAETGAPSRKP